MKKECDSLQDLKNGLSQEEVAESRKMHGENKLCEYKRKSFFKCFLSNLNDPIIKVLIGALFINLIFMFPNINWFESGGILSSIIIASLVSTVSEYSSENTFEKLKEQSKNTTVIVKRGGEVCEISSEEVVVGDLYIVNAGQGIVADSHISKGEICVDESALTGESTEVLKKSGDKILKGSLALSGDCEAIVSAVGEDTYYGKVAKELRSSTRPSPLKRRLSALAKSISRIGYVASVLVAFAYLFNTFFMDTGFDWQKTALMLKDAKLVFSKLLNALTLAVSIVVVAVPEGLPMMITVVLSSNMKRMMKDNVLVRKLVGIETSGNINLLFTDKTGTLTEGHLKVKEIRAAGGEKFLTLQSLKKAQKYEKYVTLCAGLCNNATLKGKNAIGGDATDRCLKEFFVSRFEKVKTKRKIPFDSAKKYSCTEIICSDEELLLFKGAPEKIIGASSFYFDVNGDRRTLTNESLSLLQKNLNELTKKAYRVVALAIKNDSDTQLKDLTFVSLVAIRDKIRKEVPSAIKSVQEAGIGVVMITGDNPNTAQAIAEDTGIISPFSQRNTVITGDELEKMSDNEIGELLPRLAVVARALPADKSRLVRVAQDYGYVVGMTGDGINDSPSLKAADVGFGMGSGTDVAKEACDIVIGDNNFVSIVKAILYGRTIFESIRKFIVFQLTMNMAAVGISLLGPLIGIDNPVTVTQMLWVNIIMDTLGALAFAKEPYLQEYMRAKPKSMKEQIISKRMAKQIVFTAGYVLILCVWFLKSNTLPMILRRGDDKYILSAFFAMFIFAGIFTCFTARTTRTYILANIRKNKSFLLIMLFISVMQMAFIYFGKDTFRTVPLVAVDLFKIILISFSVVIFDFVRKLTEKILYRGEKRCGKKDTFLKVKE